MTDYELYTMIERDYFEQGCKAFAKAYRWKQLSKLPLIGKFANKRADVLTLEGDTCFEISVRALKISWQLKYK